MTPPPEEPYVCGRCTMSFKIGRAHGGAERLKCPDCRLEFWCGGNSHSGKTTVGMEIRPA